MTNEERAAVRTAFRPFMEALAGRSGSVSPEEWAAAVDRIFPSESAIAREVYALAEDTSQRFGDLAMEKNTPEGNYARGAIGEAKSIARAINAIMPIAVESTTPAGHDIESDASDVAELVDTLRETRNELSWCGSQLLQLKRGRKGDCVDQVLDRAAAVLAKHGA